METLATLLAGLGLFFIGIKFVGENLKRLTGRRFRRLVAASTRRGWSAAAVGTVAGGLTQSSNAVTFIAVSLVAAGLAGVAQTAPLVAWANVGTAGLVLLAAVDLRLMVLFLLGLVGIAYYFDVERSPRWRHLAGALLGIGLLFLGLQLIRSAGGPLRELEWMTEFLRFAGTSDLLGLLIGLLLALVLQSSATLTVMAVTLTGLGLLSLDQTVVLVLGAGIGSGASVGLMAANLDGTARQLALYQVAVKTIGSLAVLLLFWLERDAGLPLLLAAAAALVESTAMQVALIFLAVQLTGGLLSALLQAPLLRLCAGLSPPAPHEELSRPRYLYDQALDDAGTALELAEREQRELLERLPGLLPAEGEDPPWPEEAARILEASSQLSGEIDRFLAELLHRGGADDTLEWAMNLQGRNALAAGLCETLGELLGTLERLEDPERPLPLAGNLVEAGHTLLLTLLDAVSGGDPLDRALLREMSGDRAELMEGIRRDLLRGEASLDQARREGLFAATSLFERLVWLVRRYAALLPEPDTDGAGEGA